MLYSMTGYASKMIIIDNVNFNLELKSVNHRFLDITIKSNEELKPLEQEIRQIISNKIQRSKLDFKCFIKENSSTSKSIALNNEVATQYLQAISQLQSMLHDLSPVSPTALLTLPGVIQQQQITVEDMKNNIFTNVEELVNEYQQTLKSEGEKLKSVLSDKLSQMHEIVKSAQPLINEAIEDYQTKLKDKLMLVLNDQALADTRIQQEIAVFCQKIDVTEELDRLAAHLVEFNKLISKGGIIGKRLDFICQEMNREANTFGSKSVSIKTTQKAVDLKVLIEQIREQVQNIM